MQNSNIYPITFLNVPNIVYQMLLYTVACLQEAIWKVISTFPLIDAYFRLR